MKSILSLATVLLGFSVLISCNSNSQSDEAMSDFVNVGQQKFEELEKQENTVVIDVRTPGEVEQGKIKGADLFIDFRGSDFEGEIDKLDKDKTYVVYCKSGGRSAAAAKKMIDKGFKHVYNLEGGISNWKGETEK